MKPLLAPLALFIATTSNASSITGSWDDLEPGKPYALKKSVTLKPNVVIASGVPLKYLERVSLDPVQVFRFDFKMIKCPPSLAQQKTDIVMVDRDYGMELQPGCLISIYVETKDYYHVSLLDPAHARN